MAEKEACTDIAASVKAELKSEQQGKTVIKSEKEVIKAGVNDESETESEYEEIEIVEEVTDDSSAEVEEEDEEEGEEEGGEEEEDKIEEEGHEVSNESSEEEVEEESKPAPIKSDSKITEVHIVAKREEKTTNVAPNNSTSESSKLKQEQELEAKEQSKSIILPLLQGLLQKQNSQSAANTTNSNPKTSSDNDLVYNSNNTSEEQKPISQEDMASRRADNNGLTVHHIEDSGTESGEDLKFIAAGLRDSLQIHSIENQNENELINEVTTALNRLESSLREGKDLKLDAKKRSALLTLVARLQTGLISPEKITAPTPAPGQTADGDNELSSPDGDTRKYPRPGHQRFAKRRNRANRHTVGVSREELADARRYIEEMVMMESISNRTTPDSGNIVSPPEYPVQKQNSCGAVLGNDTKEPSNLFRPNQFVPPHLKEGVPDAVEQSSVQMRDKKPRTDAVRQSYHFEQAAQQSEITRRPYSQAFPPDVTHVSLNPEVPISEAVQEKNIYNQTHHSVQPALRGSVFSGMRPSAYQPQESPIDMTKSNRFMNKKMMMKRANTIDIPKPIKYMNDMESDSEAEERGINSTKSIGLRGTVQVSVKRAPKSVVPPFQPKTENDLKFLAFIQKQNPSSGLAWNNPNRAQSGNPANNWSNKFGNIKNAFESGQIVTNNKPPMPSGVSSSARNFWKKTETTQAKPITKVPGSPKSNDKIPKIPWGESAPLQSPKLVVPKPVPVNKFSHAPMSAFKPVSPTSYEREPLQFQPIHSDQKPLPHTNGSFSEPLHANNSKQTMQTSYTNQASKMVQSPTLPWAGRIATENRVQNTATKFESRPQRHHSARVQDQTYNERINGYNRMEIKRPSLPNTAQCDSDLKAPQIVQDMMHAAIMKEFPPIPYTSTTYVQPEVYSSYVPEVSVTYSDSLTNPAAEPLVLTNDRPFISPYGQTDSIATSPNVTQNEISDSELDTDSIMEYKAETKIMQGPVSQQAVTISNRTMRRGDEGKFDKHSNEAKNLLTIMKNIKPANAPITKEGRNYQAPKVESILPVSSGINRFTQEVTSPPVLPPSTVQGYNPIYQQPQLKHEPERIQEQTAYQSKSYISSSVRQPPVIETQHKDYRRVSYPENVQTKPQINYVEYPQDISRQHYQKTNEKSHEILSPKNEVHVYQKSDVYLDQQIPKGYPMQPHRKDDLSKTNIKPFQQAVGTTQVKSSKILTQSNQQIIKQNTKKMITSSAPTTPEKRIQPFTPTTKSTSNPSTPQEEPKMVFKKFGPPQPHHYHPNAYQYPLAEQPRKFSEPNIKTVHTGSKTIVNSTNLSTKIVAPKIVETPSSPRPMEKSELPSHVIYNNVNRNVNYDPNSSVVPTKFPVNSLSRSDSWHQICQQTSNKPPSPQNTGSTGGYQLRRVKSGQSLEVPKMYEAGMKKAEIVQKQKTVAAYFSGQKSPNSLSRNSSQTDLVQTGSATASMTVKKSSINRIKTSEKASISKQIPSSGLSRSHTMPHIASIHLLDESNVEDAFEQLLNAS